MNWNIIDLIQQPLYQALLFSAITPILILILRPANADKAWVIAVIVFVAFLIVNAGLLWLDDHAWRYFFYSIGSALCYLLLISILMPALLRVVKIDGSGESSMAFLVIIYQPFALLLVMLVKWIVVKWF